MPRGRQRTASPHAHRLAKLRTMHDVTVPEEPAAYYAHEVAHTKSGRNQLRHDGKTKFVYLSRVAGKDDNFIFT
jgi:hypothetical protein